MLQVEVDNLTEELRNLHVQLGRAKMGSRLQQPSKQKCVVECELSITSWGVLPVNCASHRSLSV